MNCLLVDKMTGNVKIILEKVREGKKILSVRKCGSIMLETQKVGNFANFVLSYNCICLHYLYHEMLVSGKLDVSRQKG